MPLAPFLATTHRDWFDFLSSVSTDQPLDEVNFWSPTAQIQMKRMRPGEPMFFKLKSPDHFVAGYGFFAHFTLLDLDLAWSTFGPKNGAFDRSQFLRRIGEFRKGDLLKSEARTKPLACTILRDPVFWPRERWIPWGADKDWPMQAVKGASVRNEGHAEILLDAIVRDSVTQPEEFAPRFEVLDVDERKFVEAQACRREGQGAFRSRLLDAYGRRCAISGERTEPVLDAAHVQPYLGARSNHIQNGLLLTKELHALFDIGLVTVTKDYRVRVSSKIRAKWNNGVRYYAFDNRELVSMPKQFDDRPSLGALQWHEENRFLP